MIPFFDLKLYNQQFEDAFSNSLKDVLDSGRYIFGEQVKGFEKKFADYCGTKHCIGVANGLDALTIILRSYIELGRINSGDEVLVPANTYIASILAIIKSGLQPVMIEPDEQSYTISPKAMASNISWKTRAVMPVHLYGQLADMDAIQTIAQDQGLLVIEDAAQAHGAEDDNSRKAGNLGHAAGFSFYPSKNLGALGDGGCITTNNDELAQMVRMIRNYGTSSKYVNDVIGYNSRLDAIQAAFLNVKLDTLDQDNEKRRAIAKRYLDKINNSKISLPEYDNSNNHVFHQFVIRVDDRDDFIQYLTDNGVETLIHYPIAPHKQKALKEYNHLNLPLTEKIHSTVVSIPLNPILTDADISTIVKLINTY